MHLLLLLLPSTTALFDCLHGFVGRMQATVGDDYVLVNDTAMCSAMYCIKVFVRSAFDDDNIFQQGVSSRCAYTGGDRQVCSQTNGCQDISFYDGMRGNFSFCCCKENNCNSVGVDELQNLYAASSKKPRLNASSFSSYAFAVGISTALFSFRSALP